MTAKSVLIRPKACALGRLPLHPLLRHWKWWCL